MSKVVVTLGVSIPWWWRAAMAAAVVWSELRLPMNRAATVAWFAARLRFKVR